MARVLERRGSVSDVGASAVATTREQHLLLSQSAWEHCLRGSGPDMAVTTSRERPLQIYAGAPSTWE